MTLNMESGRSLELDLIGAVCDADEHKVRRILLDYDRNRDDERKGAAWINIDRVLYMAVRAGNLNMVDLIIQQCRDRVRITFPDHNGRQALHHASLDGHFGIVRKLLSTVSDISLVNCADNRGYTPLMLATEQGHMDVVRYFLEYGVEFKLTSTETSPLHIACKSCNLDMVEILVPFVDHGIRDRVDITVLHEAVLGQNVEIVEFLSKCGFSVESSNSRGKRPLHLATQDWDLQMVRALIRLGASAQSTDHDGYTPLHMAMYGSYIETTAGLVRANATTAANMVSTPASQFAPDVVTLLLNSGADINALSTEQKETPLMVASFAGEAEMVELLVSRGAELNWADSSGRTALHKALNSNADSNKKKTMMTKLITGGAKINEMDNKLYTPLHNLVFKFVIQRYPDLPLLKILVQYGADLVPSIQPERGQVDILSPNFSLQAFSSHRNSPLCWLTWREFYQAATYLVNAGWDLRRENWLDFPGKSDEHCQFLDWLLEQSRSTRPLSILCRNAIRQHFVHITQGRDIFTPISRLLIPKALKTFLNLEEL